MRKVLQPFKYKDYVVPKGDIVITVPGVNHHLESIFKNPYEFDPARFDKKGRYVLRVILMESKSIVRTAV